MTGETTAAARVSAIILAAGESRRMGNENKLLTEIDGESLVRRSARILTDSNVGEVIIVLGHESELIAESLLGLDVRLVRNPRYREGQMTSVHAGLAAVDEIADGIMIALADQPLISARDLNVLVDAFSQRGEKSIVVPTWQGERGNPIILAAEHRSEILARADNLGCKHLIARNPDLVLVLPFENDHVVRDIDSAADLQAIRARLESA